MASRQFNISRGKTFVIHIINHMINGYNPMRYIVSCFQLVVSDVQSAISRLTAALHARVVNNHMSSTATSAQVTAIDATACQIN